MCEVVSLQVKITMQEKKAAHVVKNKEPFITLHGIILKTLNAILYLILANEIMYIISREKI